MTQQEDSTGCNPEEHFLSKFYEKLKQGGKKKPLNEVIGMVG